MTVYVRFAPKADKWTDVSVRRLCANRAGRGSDKVSPRESLERPRAFHGVSLRDATERAPTASRSRGTITTLGESGIGRIEAKSISPATAKPEPPSEPRRNFPSVMRRRAGPACFV
jgi:hypothetical protein